MDRTPPARDDRRVFLGMPGYGELTAGAARGFWRATRLPDERVYYAHREGSLLAANFNGLWCDALNLAREGGRVDYFAMQHADVEPCDGWLDLLIDELEDRGLDLLGVAVPIKDAKGLTSTALARPDGDPWRPLCRITQHELHRLPATFTAEDVGGRPILLNTGLWACRFDPAWASKVRFTINDRIVVGPDGRYRPECEPEDWYFSRLCHELGLRVGCTRKIPLAHRGPARFSNSHVWGEEFDSAWTEASVVPDDLPGFRFPRDVPGWLTIEEGRALARLARGRRVLEIGSYCGRSTICLAQTAERVASIDPHDGRGTAVPRGTLAEFRANLARYGVAERVDVLVGTTPERPPNGVPAPRYDLAFIDGAHDLLSVERDVAYASAHLAPGGLIAFHDYGSDLDPDVSAAVDALIARGGTLVSLSGSVAVVEPPAEIPQLLEA